MLLVSFTLYQNQNLSVRLKASEAKLEEVRAQQARALADSPYSKLQKDLQEFAAKNKGQDTEIANLQAQVKKIQTSLNQLVQVEEVEVVIPQPTSEK